VRLSRYINDTVGLGVSVVGEEFRIRLKIRREVELRRGLQVEGCWESWKVGVG